MITADFRGMISNLSTAGETLSSSSWQDNLVPYKACQAKVHSLRGTKEPADDCFYQAGPS